MSAGSSLPMDLLVPWSRALLLGTFGYSLFRTIRGEDDLADPFEKGVVGIICLSFYPWASRELEVLSSELLLVLSRASADVNLKTIVLDALKRSAAPVVESGNIAILVDQVLRIGVWGVLQVAIQFVFLLASLILETAHEVFWKLLWILFPIGCGLFPIFPRMLTNQCLYAIELSLWLPVLSLVEILTSEVARDFMLRDGSLGLYIVAVQLIAVLLILSVPMMTHQFLSGAFAGDFGSSSSLIQTGRRWVSLAQGRASQKGSR